MKKLYTLVLALSCIIISAYSQNKEWEVGMFLGWSVYQGDMIGKTIDLKEANTAVGITGRYDYYYTLKIRANLLFGRLTGADINYPGKESRNASFQTSLIELSGMAEWEPFGKARTLKGGKSKFFISPYFLGGLGLVFTNPKAKFPSLGNPDSQSPVIQDLRSGYSKIHLVVPLGGGLRYDLNDKWMIGAELAGRVPFTDYLDGISESANSNSMDFYWFYGLTVMFKPNR
ncbi:MAG: DUF6089 family protein [Saprospiraceae bacterium]|nr:DUF6089 family protein [Saprospiraceae bacterium]